MLNFRVTVDLQKTLYSKHVYTLPAFPVLIYNQCVCVKTRKLVSVP